MMIMRRTHGRGGPGPERQFRNEPTTEQKEVRVMKKRIAVFVGACTLMVTAVTSISAQETDSWFRMTTTTVGIPPVPMPAVDPPATRNYRPTGLGSGPLVLPMGRGGFYNPARCQTAPLWPHESSHRPGTISAGVIMNCPIAVPGNSVEAKLWEKRWWGYNVIGGPRYSDLGMRRESRVGVYAACRRNYIRVTGYGHYAWGNTHVISPEVSKTVFIDC